MKKATTTHTASIRVHAGDVLGEINPFVYGQQLEFMGPCIDGGLWAELLRNRKFGIPDQNGDGVSDEWIPVGNGETVSFELDRDQAFCGPHSQRITLARRVTDERVGIRQDYVPAQFRRRYSGYICLRASDFGGGVKVGLGRGIGAPYITEEVGPITEEWTKFPFELVAPLDDVRCGFQILVSGEGTVWIGSVSFMSQDNIDGMVEGVLDLLKRSRPPHMRWPGGCYADHYHFEQALGRRDKRPMRYDSMWLAWSPNDFGTDEFIAFCRAVGAEPSITLNVKTGTPEEAAHWVEYCNGDMTTPYGKKRAENGHPEPYSVKYWSVGNESWDYMSAEEYADKVNEYVPVIKAVDPNIIVCAVGGEADWDVTVAKEAGQNIDWIAQHHYFPGIWTTGIESEEQLTRDILFHPAILEQWLVGIRTALDKEGTERKKRLDMVLDEWNAWPTNELLQPGFAGSHTSEATMTALVNDLQRDFSLREGLYACGVFHMLYRLAGDVLGANVFTSCNQLGIIRTDGLRTFATSSHRGFELYRNHSGSRTVRCEAEGPTAEITHQNNVRQLPYLDVVATASDDGSRLFIHVINRHLSDAIKAHVSVEEFAPAKQGVAYVLTGDSWDARNSFSHPDYVNIREEALSNLRQNFEYTFPPHSAVTIELRAE